MGEGSRKCSSFKLCFNLNDNQLKSSRYSYRSTYMNLKVTKNPQQIHTQKKNREKRAQAHHQRKSSNHKGRNQKKERTEKNDKNREQVTK